MYRATSILTALFFVSGLGAGETSFASEATSSVATETKVSSPIEPSQSRNLLRQLAIDGDRTRDRCDPKLYLRGPEF